MTIVVISRKPFMSRSILHVQSVAVSGDNVNITSRSPGATEDTVDTFNRFEVILNVNARED